MKRMSVFSVMVALALVAMPSIAAVPSETGKRDARRSERDLTEQEQDIYEEANDALDDHDWRRAESLYLRLAGMHGSHAEQALYWRAYAQNKLGNRSESLATLVEFQKAYPKSRWSEDAKALEVEIRQSAGQKVEPDNVSDEDVKLMAINGLMTSDPERAIPILEKILNGPYSSKLKDRAMFVISQSHAPRSLEILARSARDSSRPDLQARALKYLGILGGDESRRVLNDVYVSTNDLALKKSILRSFMVGGDKERLYSVAKAERNEELRGAAVSQLGILGGRNELAGLYAAEPSVEVRKQIIRAMFIGGSADQLGELARTEKVPELRVTAIKNLGLIGGARSGEILSSIYGSDSNLEVRHAVIKALFLHGDARTLVSIGKQEKNPELRRSIVSTLSLMRSKDAEAFLLDVLNQ